MTILAAVDGEYEQDRVIEVGHDLAEAYDVNLVVLHVMDRDQFEELRRGSEITPPVMVGDGEEQTGLAYITTERSRSEYDLEDAMDDAKDVAQKCVFKSLSDDHPPNVTIEGRVGDPATEIVKTADRIDAQYIVVGGRKKSPVGKALFGSTSQSVILDSRRPVVTILRKN